jgi:hypothetical protein
VRRTPLVLEPLVNVHGIDVIIIYLSSISDKLPEISTITPLHEDTTNFRMERNEKV